jgi:hypothetical protein
MTEIGRGLLVQAQASGQGAFCRDPGQARGGEEKREGAQQQRAAEDHGLVHEIQRVQPVTQVFSR